MAGGADGHPRPVFGRPLIRSVAVFPGCERLSGCHHSHDRFEEQEAEMRTIYPAAEGDWDVVIVGGGIGGLAAAAYVARAGKRTLLLEAREKFSGRAENIALGEGISVPIAAEAFYALDQKLLRDLQLHKFGLRITKHAMPLTALRLDGRHLTLPLEPYQAREAMSAEGSADAAAYRTFHRDQFALAQKLRSLWIPRGDSAQWRRPLGSLAAVSQGLSLSGDLQEQLEIVAHSSANAYLRNWFESDRERLPHCPPIRYWMG